MTASPEKSVGEVRQVQLGEDFRPFDVAPDVWGHSRDFQLEGLGKGHVVLTRGIEITEIDAKDGLRVLEEVAGEYILSKPINKMHELWPTISYDNPETADPNLRCVITVGGLELVSSNEKIGEKRSESAEFGLSWNTDSGHTIVLIVPDSALPDITMRFERILLPIHPAPLSGA